MYSRHSLTKDIYLLLAATFLFFCGFNLLLPTFPLYVSSLGGSERVVGLLGGLFALAAVAQRPYMAYLTDAKGRKVVLIISAIAAATGPLFYLVSTSFWGLAVARIYHALSLAAFVTAGQTLMADLSPENKRGALIGLHLVFSGLPAAVFPPLGFYLIEEGSFLWLFLIAALLGLGMILPLIGIHEPPKTSANALETTKPAGNLLANRNAITACAGIAVATIILGALNTFLPLYGANIGIANVGLFFTVFALAFMVGSAFSGRLSDLHGRRRTILPAYILVAAAMFLLIFMRGYLILSLAAAVFGLGFSTLQTVLLVFTVDSTGRSERSRAISLYNNAFDLGASAGAMGLGIVAAYSFHLLWTLLASIALAGFLLALRFLCEPAASPKTKRP